LTPRDRPDVVAIFRSRPEEELERRRSAVARAALVIGPLLVLGPVVLIFYPFSDASWLWLDLTCLALSPAVLSLAWGPGGSRSRARSVTAITTVLVGLEIGWVGLQANPCAADPTVVGIVGAAAAIGVFLAASTAGRQLALEGRLVVPLLVAAAIGFVGFLMTAFWVLPQVLVLCGP
jgi:hypothetical protein